MGSGKPSTPLVTVDLIIEVSDGLVLVERRYPPPGWALPGGFVEPGESLAVAAMREAKEETSLDVDLMEQFFAYSDPGRDPRGPTVSVVFLGRGRGVPVAADDAAQVGVFSFDGLPALAFDHAGILDDYRRYRDTGRRPGPLR
jgi:ADP-ribose pyrophosphatase YjhB (NUDIX family)